MSPQQLRPAASALAQLSTQLNDLEPRRAGAPVYMRDRRLRDAYRLYYVTANMLKPCWALGEIWPAGPPRSASPLRVLDLGCGPGTGAATMHAWYDTIISDRHVLIDGIDIIGANVEQYRRLGALLADITGHPITCTARIGDAAVPEGDAGSYDLVMALNLLNELPETKHERFLARCGELLAAGGVLLLLEPALRETTRPLLRLRDQAVAGGWQVLLPCFRQAECPALANEKDWCHHDLPWQRPEFIAFLDEAVGNIKKSLKFSCIALTRDEAGSSASGSTAADTDCAGVERLRVVSELFVEKGRSWCYCCGAAGRNVYQRNTRDRSEANAAFDLLRRYDALRVMGAEKRAHDVRISPSTVVTNT